MRQLISVIVPVYNVEKYVSQCVDSLIHQTYDNIEIILVDDGSTDESGKICDSYLEKDKRIRVIHKENGGLSDARNAGIEVAKGEFFSFVDGDDYLSYETIDNLYTASVNTDSDISVCNIVRVYSDGSTENFYKPSEQSVVLEGILRFETLKQPSVCNKLFKADLFSGVRFPYGKLYEDTFVYHELLYKANRVVLTGFDGYWYLSRESSILGKEKFTDGYFDMIEAVWKRAEFLIDHNVQPYADEACLSLYSTVASAEKNITKTEKNIERFKCAYRYYGSAYKMLLRKDSNISIKQKIRLILLKFAPTLHVKLYGGRR